MSNKTKKILTGHVARIIDGVLVTAGPGDVAPDWVTNPDLIADAGAEESTPEPAGGTPAGDGGNTPPAGAGTPPAGGDGKTPEGDDLDDKKGDELKAIAGDLGVAKSGSKPELIARIRAKRAEQEPAGDTGDAGDTAREALVEKAKAAGIDDAEDRTDAELLAVVGQED